MARIFIENFEAGNLDIWDAVSNATIVSTAGLGLRGNYCVKLTSDAQGYVRKNLPSAISEIGFAFFWRPRNLSVPSYYTYILEIYSDATRVFYIAAYGTGSAFSWSEYGGVNYGICDLFSYTTYFLQGFFKRSTSTDGIIHLKINSVVDMDFTKRTATSANTFNKVGLHRNAYWDNFVLDSEEEPEQTEIIILRPNGVGNYSDFVPTPSGNNYTCVDDVPYNDADYVSSGIVNAIDTYTLEDLPSNAKSVKCIQPQLRARKDSDSPLTKFNFVMRDGSTNYHSNDISLSNIFDTYSEMRPNGPTGSGVWHPSNVNSLEIGVRTRT